MNLTRILLIAAAAVVAVAAFSYFGGGSRLPAFFTEPLSPATVFDQTETTALPPTSGRILADAVVVPARNAALSVKIEGIVQEVLVEEGDRVEAGQLLARLESNLEIVTIAQAQAAVDFARAQAERLRAGARPEEIAAAQAAVESAQAQLGILQDGARPEDVTIAQAAVEVAQGAYAAVAAGPDQEELIAAQADMANAEAVLRQAQSAYDQVRWRTDIGTLPEAAALEQATNAYNAARARYDVLAAGVPPATLAEAGAAIRQAQAELARVQSPATANELAAAEALVRQAQAQLDLFLAGTHPAEIAAAEAEVARAEGELMAAQVALADKELRAPFAGEIAALNLRVGQQVTPEFPVVQLADTAAWWVETTDLTEISVVEVDPGDKASVTVDALSDVDFTGEVISVQRFGQNTTIDPLVPGDILYRVTILLDQNDPRLRWNMTASVAIEP